MGNKAPALNGYRGSLAPETYEQVRSLLADGIPAREAARTLDVSYGQVRGVAEHVDQRRFTTSPMRVAVWDLETTNLRSDIGTLLVAAFLDLGTGETQSRTIDDYSGNTSHRERQLATWAGEQYAAANILVGFNSIGFDKNFLNGVRGRQRLEHLPPRFHIDLYQVARHGWKGIPQSYSLANLADVFGLHMQKDKPSKHDWRLANAGAPDAIERLRVRCIADVELTALVWECLEPFWQRWKGR